MRNFSKVVVVLAAVLICTICFASDLSEIYKQGEALEKAWSNDEALQLYKDALKEHHVPELYIKMGSLLGQIQRYDEAEKILKEGLEKFPENTALLNLKGLVFFKCGNFKEAGKLWERVLKIKPDNSFALEWFAKVKGTSDSGKKEVPSSVGSQTIIASGNEKNPSVATNQEKDMDKTKDRDKDKSKDKDKTAENSKLTDVEKPKEIATASPTSEGAVLPLEEQKKLAKKLYSDMAKTEEWKIDEFETMHRQVIFKCPDTDYAEESCWRLSNLYLMGSSEPKYPEIIEILEHLVTKYPGSKLIPDAKNRLLNSYRETGKMDKVVELYAEKFRTNPQPSDKEFMVWAIEYGDALKATGRNAEAESLFKQVIDKDNNKDGLEARVAKQRLEAK
ncbi:MAG: tetratricopeptide repeat protein [Candidatus Riflebacteria bacterium]|nr:tetratricopeptide repeat protein [Candidatus Riflebacteria bacterium]